MGGGEGEHIVSCISSLVGNRGVEQEFELRWRATGNLLAATIPLDELADRILQLAIACLGLQRTDHRLAVPCSECDGVVQSRSHPFKFDR